MKTNTFEQFAEDFIRQQEITKAIAQLEDRIDIIREHQTDLVRNWFCAAHPDLALKMVKRPNDEPNFDCYTVGASDENPMGTHISIRFLVEYDAEDCGIWLEKCYPLTDLQNI